MANAEQTEKATPSRRKKATDKGQFAYSQEVTGVLTLFACLGVTYSLFRNPAGYRAFLENMLRAGIAGDSDVHMISLVRQA